MANGHGGKRPGAGRPRKAIILERPIRDAEQRVADKLPWVLDKLFELVDGVYEERQIDEETRLVYRVRPDRAAAIYLVDRVLGKPIERTEQGEAGTFERGYEIRLVRVSGHAAAS